MTRFMIALVFVLSAGACTTVNCRELREKSGQPQPASEIPKEMDPMSKPSLADRVKIFKPDGSLQCGQRKAVPVADMQQELKDITVFSAANRHDGMMHPQQCGLPTGNANIYEISRKDLAAALKRGFREWTHD